MAQTSFTHADLMTLWELNGGSPALADTAAAVAQAESGGCLYAKHGPTDDRPVKICKYIFSTGEDSYGLWQINRQAHPQYSAASLYTANGNAAAAVAIATGAVPFYPWTQYRNGAYIPFLTTAAPGPVAGPPGPTPAQGGASMQAVRAWGGVSDAVARTLPRDIAAAARTTQGALRKLGKLSKVS